MEYVWYVIGGVIYFAIVLMVIFTDMQTVRRSCWEYPLFIVLWWYFLYRGLARCDRFKR